MRRIDNVYRSADHRTMFVVIRDTDARESEVWVHSPEDGRGIRHVRTFEHARDAAQKAATLADTVNTLTSQTAWDKAVMS